jgi:mono/diheme cytochrome c family protein
MRYTFFLPLLAAGCGSSNRIPPPAGHKVDFAVEVRPIFQKHCYPCHGPTKQKGEYRLDIKEIALRPEVVRPGDGTGSPLIEHLVGANDRAVMPPDPPRLTDEQVGLIRAWIDQGATWVDEKK